MSDHRTVFVQMREMSCCDFVEVKNFLDLSRAEWEAVKRFSFFLRIVFYHVANAIGLVSYLLMY